MCSNLDDFADPLFWEADEALLKARWPKGMIRGLRSRVLHTGARMMTMFDAGRAEVLRFCAGWEAMRLGEQDARDAICRPPLMFAGAGDLRAYWQLGFDGEIKSLEWLGCRQWHDGSGRACPVHG
ncbi:hypothetical protein GCM10027277_25690 [Pseudoduganella ginsengisoli]|jgi:hypothetical protein|uniref:Uncharacterized protein n=1 Tax=Pseudoduganella ginsengisoli TaxID=1462440 RepID=A0A6L6PZW5_9BURK|nr:hypothetical protein [Pseudoduganella ginsengisoli]MTW02709.1 hypothetical protein [Pseudoduganella ginsengisoli]